MLPCWFEDNCFSRSWKGSMHETGWELERGRSGTASGSRPGVGERSGSVAASSRRGGTGSPLMRLFRGEEIDLRWFLFERFAI